MSKILNFNMQPSGFELLVDVGKSQPVSCVALTYPDETTVTVRGNEEVVKQIVERLDHQIIEYTSSPQIKIGKA